MTISSFPQFSLLPGLNLVHAFSPFRDASVSLFPIVYGDGGFFPFPSFTSLGVPTRHVVVSIGVRWVG